MLEITKESVKAVPVPGLEAAVSSLSAVLNVYGAMRANEEALKLLGEALESLDKHITRPLKETVAKDTDFLDEDLKERLNELAEELTNLAKRAEAMQSRKAHKKIFGYKEDSGLIQELNKELDRIILTFTAQGSIGSEVEARKARKAAQMVLINGLRRAQARHDSSSRVGTNACFEGTRVGILQAISAWIEDSGSSSIFWLSGMAGIGKSTIAQTVAELEESKHRLGASFFFSRDDAERRDPGLVCPTIAYQLAIFDDALKRSVTCALEKDPDVAFRMVKTQFEELIAKPLKGINKSGKTIVFVLDALDECDPTSGAVEILSRWAVELPRISQETKIILKVLLTSRPELHIQNQFRSPSLRPLSQQFILHNVEESVVQADIELFLRYRFTELADLHGMAKPWPLESDLLELVERSSNLFIFAATAINFVASAKSGRLMQARLEMLLEPVSLDPASVYQKLDACYLHILQVAERELEPTMQDARKKFRLILEAIVLLRNPLSAVALESLLSLAPGDVITAIQDLGSVLVLPDINDSSTPVRIFHPSFYDFITSPSRHSGDFFLPTAECHARLAQICFTVIRKSLQRHPRFVGDPCLSNSEVLGAADHLQTMIPVHLGYACRFLASHVSLTSTRDDSLAEAMKIFCENDLLTWLETMSLLGDIDNAVSSIQAMRAWCSKTPSITEHTSELLYDAYRVLLQYQLPLRHSAGHLYTTVLSFSPPCSLTKQYASQLHVESVVQGKPDTWDANLITLEVGRLVATVAPFPHGERIVTADYAGSVAVWSSATGAFIMSMECNLDWDLDDYGGPPILLTVARDGTKIACAPAITNSIHVWDANTGANVAILGGWVTEEPWRFSGPNERCGFVTFLPGSNDIVSISDVCTFYRWDSHTLEVKYTCDLHDEQPDAVDMAQGGLTLAVLHGKTLRIWSIGAEGITLVRELRGAHSYLPRVVGSYSIAFLPGTTKIVCGAGGDFQLEIREITIWDYVSGARLQHMKANFIHFALSCDGARLAAAANSEIQIYDTDSFTLLGRLIGHSKNVKQVAFLQKGSMLVSVGEDLTVRIWDCAKLSTPTAPSRSKHHETHDRILASQDGEKIAVLYRDTLLLLDSSLHTFGKLTVESTTEPEVDMSPDGRFIVVSKLSGRNPLQCSRLLYETETLECIYTYQLSYDRPAPSVFSDDGHLLAMGCIPTASSTVVVLFSLVTKTVILARRLSSNLRPLAFSPDNKHLLCFSSRETGYKYKMFDVFTGKKVLSGELPPEGGWSIDSARFWPDGLSILVLESSGEAYVLEANTLRTLDRFHVGTMVQVVPTNSGPELTFLLCKDGGYLYHCTRDKELPLIWLPPSWRAPFGEDESGARKAVWRGSRVIFLLENGELGVLDLQAALKSRAGEGADGENCAT